MSLKTILGGKKKPKFLGYMIISNTMSIAYAFLLQSVVNSHDSPFWWALLLLWIIFSNGVWYWLSRG